MNCFENCFVLKRPISSRFHGQPFSVLIYSLPRVGHAFKFDQVLPGSEEWNADEFHWSKCPTKLSVSASDFRAPFVGSGRSRRNVMHQLFGTDSLPRTCGRKFYSFYQFIPDDSPMIAASTYTLLLAMSAQRLRSHNCKTVTSSLELCPSRRIAKSPNVTA